MESGLQARADQLLGIYKAVSKDYKWKNSNNMNNMIALYHVLRGKEYSKEKIDRVNRYIKKNTGPFSCYRQKSILFSALLAINYPDPEDKFDILLDYEQKLKYNGFRSYTYRPVTAYTLLLTCKEHEADERIAKAYKIFTDMRKNHPWLTSGDDYPLAVLLAGSDEPVHILMEKIEMMYDDLTKAGFGKSNGLQFLSHILTFSTEDNRTKAERCRKLYDIFKENKLKVYSSNYGSLGLLTLLEGKSEEAAYEVIRASRYLSEDRKYRRLGKETVFLTAAALVCDLYLENMKKESEIIQTTSFITIEALIAAQSAAMLGATCAATAAVS